MKKLINVAMASVLGLSVVGVSQAANNQGSGTVNFRGQLIDAPCSIASGSTNKVVEFGDLSTALLEEGKKIVPFSIKLENCDTTHSKAKTGAKTVKIAFAGPTANGNPIMLSTSGETGVGIMISTLENNSYVRMDGTPITASSFMDGSGEILLEAVAEKAHESVDLHPGEFTATANFTLSYE